MEKKSLLYIIYAYMVFAAGCKEIAHTSGEMTKDTIEAYMSEAADSLESLPCDSLGIRDYKTNLVKDNKYTLPEYMSASIDSIAHGFISERCSDDSIFCDPVYLKHKRIYKADDGHYLFSYGYAFEESESVIEDEAASFFVFGIIRDKSILFTDVAEDLLGEIQFELSGAEFKSGKATLWGEAYPYFARESGKFRLLVAGGKTSYVFECDKTED